MKLNTKFALATLGAVSAVSIVALIVQRSVIRDQGISLIAKEMEAIILQAENVRDSVSTLNQRNAFARERLIEELHQTDDYRDTTLYRTVPIVAPWNGLREVADKENCTFRVIRENPRNPDNAPDARERRILTALENGAEEFFNVDEDADLMLYARPIILSQDCLACHGDPANSPTGDGKDILGFPMENWKTGDIRGAFVLSSTLERVDSVVTAGFGKTLIWLLPIVALIVVAIYALVRRIVIRPLESAISIIDSSSREAENATGEISHASNALATGASEQAAALEETSASLEEISSTSRQNSDSARNVSEIASQASGAANEGRENMEAMASAMSNISEASARVSAIIKTIDEIAFQTNILALNAAVEAARAGEAGAGFSVVADEVRSLAARSAEAAHETSRLIEDSNRKSSEGSAICERVRESLGTIVSHVEQVSTVVGEVVAASEQQDSGVQQVNQAVHSLDNLTQQNAASAEQMASAATEVSAQAQSLREAVGDLLFLAHGEHARPPRGDSSAQPPQDHRMQDPPPGNTSSNGHQTAHAAISLNR